MATMTEVTQTMRMIGIVAGAQVGVFDDKDPIHKKRTQKHFKEVTAFEHRFANS